MKRGLCWLTLMMFFLSLTVVPAAADDGTETIEWNFNNNTTVTESPTEEPTATPKPDNTIEWNNNSGSDDDAGNNGGNSDSDDNGQDPYGNSYGDSYGGSYGGSQGGSSGNGQNGQNGQNGFFPFVFGGIGGMQGGQQQPTVAETTLSSRPGARSVKSGSDISIDYDLQLSSSDSEWTSTIEQGATMEYVLVTAPLDDESNKTFGASATAQFTMNRKNNERCTITVRPQVSVNSILTVKARMTFADGRVLENETDKILVYTDVLIGSHISAQECEPGAALTVDFMMVGPEGLWQFTAYLAQSEDGGNTYTRGAQSTTFQVNTHEREPKAKLKLNAPETENAFFRLELEVTLQDGTKITHITDPVRVSGSGVST